MLQKFLSLWLARITRPGFSIYLPRERALRQNSPGFHLSWVLGNLPHTLELRKRGFYIGFPRPRPGLMHGPVGWSYLLSFAAFLEESYIHYRYCKMRLSNELFMVSNSLLTSLVPFTLKRSTGNMQLHIISYMYPT